VVGRDEALHWDGTQWATAATLWNGSLEGVSALNPDDVWLAGTVEKGTQNAATVLHWDGTSWTQQDFPINGTFTDVDAIAPNDVWMVGQSEDGVGYIEHWNGHKWRQVASPDHSDFLPRSITTLSSNDVWIVGQDAHSEQAEIEHWEGTKLSVVPCPKPEWHSELLNVSAASPTDIWAVGDSPLPTLDWRALIVHWDGTSWSEVRAPFPGDHDTWLEGVTPVASDDAWAVGYHEVGPGPLFQIAAHWDGKAWHRVT
jgi:hypothetical protein